MVNPEATHATHGTNESGLHWTAVDGLVLPADIGGHPALALLNTWAGWTEDGATPGAPERRDYLKTYDHVATLAADRGLIPETWLRRLRRAARRDPEVAEAELDSARRLRHAAYRALVSAPRPADLTLLTQLSADARTHQRLSPARPAQWEVQRSAGLRAPVLAAASAVTDLLISPDATRVQRCPGIDCGWLFLNTSGRRRWCQMAVCGNREKARTYAARHR